MKDVFVAKKDRDILSRVVVEHYDTRYIVESPYSDAQPIEVLPELVYTILRMAGYTEQMINKAFIECAETHEAEENA